MTWAHSGRVNNELKNLSRRTPIPVKICHPVLLRTRANDKNWKNCCITRRIILIIYYSTNQKRGGLFLRYYFYILISFITFDNTKIETWSRSPSGNSAHRTRNLLPLPVEQPQWVRVRRLYIRNKKKWESRMFTSTGERAKEGQVCTWSRGLVDC